MRRRLITLLVLLVAVPLAGLAWLGVRVVQDQHQMAHSRAESLLMERLDDTDGIIALILDQRQRELREMTQLDNQGLPSLYHRTSPFVLQFFAQDTAGTLLYPTGQLTLQQQEFMVRTGHLWRAPLAAAKDGATLETATPVPPSRIGTSGDLQGWHTWFWDSGLRLIYWRQDHQGVVVGAELNRSRLLSDIIAALPDTPPDGAGMEGQRFVLADARGDPLYQWGPYTPTAGEPPRAERSLSAPLGAWQLEYYMSAASFAAVTGEGSSLGLLAGLAALVLALLGLAVFFYRESSREIREGQQRVSFVNQVSHELKTPLTSIRMYAELLGRDIDPDDQRAQRHVNVVVSESQRLSRLIGNVLTFARQQREPLVLHPAEHCLDDVIDEVLTQFELSLKDRSLEVVFHRGAPAMARFDADVVVQIVANLIGNGEKYAAAGERLEITTEQDGDRSTVVVRDHGPGIPAASADRVFEPFVRLDDALSEGVSGAGIGLALSRDLARLHGGDLTLRPCDDGACFALEFRHLDEGKRR